MNTNFPRIRIGMQYDRTRNVDQHSSDFIKSIMYLGL
jgi:hypothetical protein